MRCELTLEIRDLHACPEVPPRKVEVPKDVFSGIDVTTTKHEIDEDLAKETERADTKEKTRIEVKPCYTFKKEDGKSLFRLGGPYGKLAGLLKEAGSTLYTMKEPGFRTGYKRMIKSLIIRPQWVSLENVEDIYINKIPQLTAGMSQTMIILYYDVISKCTARITIDFPKNNKDLLEKLLKQAQGLPFGPKRRGEVQIVELNWEEEDRGHAPRGRGLGESVE